MKPKHLIGLQKTQKYKQKLTKAFFQTYGEHLAAKIKENCRFDSFVLTYVYDYHHLCEHHNDFNILTECIVIITHISY